MSKIISILSFELSTLGYGGLNDWARKRGYAASTVKNAVLRWKDRQIGMPRGKTAVILISLSKELGRPVIPVLSPYFKPNKLTEANKWKKSDSVVI